MRHLEALRGGRTSERKMRIFIQAAVMAVFSTSCGAPTSTPEAITSDYNCVIDSISLTKPYADEFPIPQKSDNWQILTSRCDTVDPIAKNECVTSLGKQTADSSAFGFLNTSEDSILKDRVVFVTTQFGRIAIYDDFGVTIGINPKNGELTVVGPVSSLVHGLSAQQNEFQHFAGFGGCEILPVNKHE